jgi:hypothetical protein
MQGATLDDTALAAQLRAWHAAHPAGGAVVRTMGMGGITRGVEIASIASSAGIGQTTIESGDPP